MSKTKSVSIALLTLLLMTGCASKPKLPALDYAVDRSYQIENGMDKEQVSTLLSVKPTTVQRINNEEIWKYEGNIVNPETKEATYHNLIIKFVDGKVKHIGTFSCKLPSVPEK